MLAQPSPGCYFLLAVIFFPGLQAQEFDEPDNKEGQGGLNATEPSGSGEDYEYYYYDPVAEEGSNATVPPLPTCHAEICVRKCCPVGQVRPRLEIQKQSNVQQCHSLFLQRSNVLQPERLVPLGIMGPN